MQRFIWIILMISILAGGCAGRDYAKVLTIKAPNFDLVDVPVYIDIETESLKGALGVCLTSKGMVIPAQVEERSAEVSRIWWVLNLKAGETKNYGLLLNKECKTEIYTWRRVSPESVRLYFGEQPVISYEHPVFDPDDIEYTKKPYHHVYDPTSDMLITKGVGGLFSHHRGIFFGYNHVDFNGHRVDIWHAHQGERSEHEAFIREFTGPVYGGHILKIPWKDRAGNIILEEVREIRVFRQDAGQTLIDFQSTLSAPAGPVKLDGDLQHAGVQFRAAQYVADNASATLFIRPEAWSHIEPASELRGDDLSNLPWNAMHFSIKDKPFTVAYLSHQDNSEITEMSERQYGRFGEFFPAMVTDGNPLKVHYRFWILAGKKPGIEDIELRYNALRSNPEIIIKK